MQAICQVSSQDKIRLDKMTKVHCSSLSSSSSSFGGYPLQVRHKQDWGRGFIFLLPQTAALPGSDAGSDVIKPASSFVIQTVRPRAPCGARCIGHAVSTWSAVCSEAPHSQFGEGARPHLCMDEWNRPTPVRRRLSLTQPAGVSPSQQAWHRSGAQKHGAWKHLHSIPFSICDFSIQKYGCQVWQNCPKDSAHLAQTGV